MNNSPEDISNRFSFTVILIFAIICATTLLSVKQCSDGWTERALIESNYKRCEIDELDLQLKQLRTFVLRNHKPEMPNGKYDKENGKDKATLQKSSPQVE